jgi:hypothetical protein
LTVIPVAAEKAGSKCVNKPDCSVEVVDANTMLWAWARDAAASRATAIRWWIRFKRVLLG